MNSSFFSRLDVNVLRYFLFPLIDDTTAVHLHLTTKCISQSFVYPVKEMKRGFRESENFIVKWSRFGSDIFRQYYLTRQKSTITSLELFGIKCYEYQPQSPLFLCYFLNLHPQLTHLSLIDCVISPFLVTAASNQLRKLKSFYSNQEEYPMINWMSNNNTLKQLSCVYNDSSFSFQLYSNLTSLTLLRNPFTVIDPVNFSYLINIKRLSLHHAFNRDVQSIFESTLSTLIHLELPNSRINKIGLLCVMKGLPLSKIHTLSLKRNKIGVDFSTFISSIKSNKTLTSLDISNVYNVRIQSLLTFMKRISHYLIF